MIHHHKKSPVQGIGINDADYKVIRCVRGSRPYTCPFYKVWVSIFNRCYSPVQAKRFPTYEGCTVHPEWHTFSAFKAWMEKQDWQGKQLDKDVLVEGNKVYGPYTCMFVSRSINNFFRSKSATRTGAPIGAHFNKATGKYNATCGNPFTKKSELIGSFDTAAEAHQAWRARKHVFACKLASTETNPRIAKALIERYAPASNDSIQA